MGNTQGFEHLEDKNISVEACLDMSKVFTLNNSKFALLKSAPEDVLKKLADLNIAEIYNGHPSLPFNAADVPNIKVISLDRSLTMALDRKDIHLAKMIVIDHLHPINKNIELVNWLKTIQDAKKIPKKTVDEFCRILSAFVLIIDANNSKSEMKIIFVPGNLMNDFTWVIRHLGGQPLLS